MELNWIFYRDKQGRKQTLITAIDALYFGQGDFRITQFSRSSVLVWFHIFNNLMYHSANWTKRTLDSYLKKVKSKELLPLGISQLFQYCILTHWFIGTVTFFLICAILKITKGGCGAFGGYHDLKAVIQLLAAGNSNSLTSLLIIWSTSWMQCCILHIWCEGIRSFTQWTPFDSEGKESYSWYVLTTCDEWFSLTAMKVMFINASVK